MTLVTPRTVRFSDRDHYRPALVFADTTRYLFDAGFRVHVTDLRAVRALDLRDALRRAKSAGYADEQVEVVTDDEEYVDEEYAPTSEVTFGLDNDTLQIGVIFQSDSAEPDAQNTPDHVERLTSALLSRNRWQIESFILDAYHSLPPYVWHLWLRPSIRGRTAHELFEVGLQVWNLLRATQGGRMTTSSALEILRSGQGRLLFGVAESGWLEAKRQHFDLGTNHGKFRLARSVASLANDRGGLLAIGLGTKKQPGGDDLIVSLHPVPLDGKATGRYLGVIEHFVTPRPEDLQIYGAECEGGMLITVHVPDQPDELKPFLVHGAIVDDDFDNSLICIPTRRGAHTTNTSPAVLHTHLTVGRALIRGGYAPRDTTTS